MDGQTQLKVRIPAPLKKRLQHASVDLGRSMSDLVSQAVQELLDKINK